MGGLPCAGVLMRNAINIKSGAKSRLSQSLSGMFMLIILLLLPLFLYLPSTCVAAILTNIAFNLLPVNYWNTISFSNEKTRDRTILIATTVAILLWDAPVGLVGGTIVFYLWNWKSKK